MEFIKNNLAFLVSTIIAVINGGFYLYQLSENKKLKKYATERDLKQRQADLEKLHSDQHGIYDMPVFFGEKEKKQSEFNHKKKHLEADVEYLKKVLKIKKDD